MIQTLIMNKRVALFGVLILLFGSKITGQQLSNLKPVHCGAMVEDRHQLLVAIPKGNSTQYEFKVENSTTGYTETLVKNANSFRLEELANAPANHTEYEVKVRYKQGASSNFNSYGNGCKVLLEDKITTGLIISDCIRKNLKGDDVLTANPKIGATEYEFSIKNTAHGINQSYQSTNNTFKLEELGIEIPAAVELEICVRVKIGGVWEAWGNICILEVLGLQSKYKGNLRGRRYYFA